MSSAEPPCLVLAALTTINSRSPNTNGSFLVLYLSKTNPKIGDKITPTNAPVDSRTDTAICTLEGSSMIHWKRRNM
jgi:hypothetical protein